IKLKNQPFIYLESLLNSLDEVIDSIDLKEDEKKQFNGTNEEKEKVYDSLLKNNQTLKAWFNLLIVSEANDLLDENDNIKIKIKIYNKIKKLNKKNKQSNDSIHKFTKTKKVNATKLTKTIEGIQFEKAHVELKQSLAKTKNPALRNQGLKVLREAKTIKENN